MSGAATRMGRVTLARAAGGKERVFYVAKLLYKLGRASYLHKWRVVVAWLLLLGATAAGALSLM